jgi:hypothetical protein
MSAVKTCPEGKIFNPNTNRCVSKTGKIGLALLANKKVPIKTQKEKPIKIHKESKESNEKIKLISYGCKKIGMTQTMGTCWFNSICNNLLLSQNCYSYFMHRYNELSIDERQAIEKKNDDSSCPLKLKIHHFYRFFYTYNKAKSNPKNIFSKMYRLYKTRNHAKNLINKLEIREHGWEKPDNQGFNPYDALSRILPIIFKENEYKAITPYQKQEISPGIRFIFIGTANGFVYDEIDKIQKICSIPAGFTLDHVNIIVVFRNTLDKKTMDGENSRGAHAFSGFICNGEYYIYDSNNHETFTIDWRKHENIKKHFANNHKFLGKTFYIPENVYYAYICYTRM